jgi:uncharacterized protein (DUF433 family)
MNKACGDDDEMRPEYDFSGGVRGKYAERYARQLVHSHPEIVSGEPVFVGTRVPARNLVEWLVNGHTLDDFLDNYPSVRREQAVEFLKQAGEIQSAASRMGDESAPGERVLLDEMLSRSEQEPGT